LATLHFSGRLEQNCRRSLAQDLPDQFGAAQSAAPPLAAPVPGAATTATQLVTLAPDSLAAQLPQGRPSESGKGEGSAASRTSCSSRTCGRTLHYTDPSPNVARSSITWALVGISAALAQDLVNFCFIGPTSDFIGTGLSIFMVSYPTTEAIAALGDSVALYNQQVDNDQSVTVKDADRIREEQKFRYPTTYAGTKEVLRAYHWLLYVVLGEQHPITVAFGLFVRRFKEKEPVYSKSINDPRSCAGLLKFVKTTVHHAIDAHFRNQSQPTLDFLSVYTKIDYEDWSPQSVPHPAIPILQQLRDEGAYVQRSEPDWSLEQWDAAVRRGAHQSTRANNALASYISSI
jgi:hypothetical protein